MVTIPIVVISLQCIQMSNHDAVRIKIMEYYMLLILQFLKSFIPISTLSDRVCLGKYLREIINSHWILPREIEDN